MNKKLARSLIYPLKVGGKTTKGWLLRDIRVAYREQPDEYDTVYYSFANPDLDISIRPRLCGGKFAAQSRNFLITVHHSSIQYKAIQEVISLIQKNDKENYCPITPLKIRIDAMSMPDHTATTAYIVPGHLGNFYDLSFRAIRVLRDVPLILLEADKQNELVAIDKAFDIALAEKQVIELKEFGAQEQQLLMTFIRSKQDLCLFGCNEGLPTLADPGWGFVKAMQELNVPIRTLSGGGALSAAVMRLGHTKQFLFFGLFSRDNYAILQYLAALSTAPQTLAEPVVLCFSSGKEIVQYWTKLDSILRLCKGNLRLMSELTRPDENEIVISFEKMKSFDTDTLNQQQKMVVVFEVQDIVRTKKKTRFSLLFNGRRILRMGKRL